MVNLNEIIEQTAAKLPDETLNRINDAVSEVIHKLPKASLMTPVIWDALDSGDKQRCNQIERETFPAIFNSIREITGSDPCIIISLIQLFGPSNLEVTLQAMAFGQLIVFECLLEYIRKNKTHDEIAELEKMFDSGLDTLNDSSDNNDMENAA